MSDVLLIQNTRIEGSGYLGELLKNDGFNITSINAKHEPIPTKDFELGTENDLSKVMVSQQISSVGFQLTLNLRNKALSAYKDIMNMPV